MRKLIRRLAATRIPQATSNALTFVGLAAAAVFAPEPWNYAVVGAMAGLGIQLGLELAETRRRVVQAVEIAEAQLAARQVAAAFAINVSDVALETAQELAKYDPVGARRRLQEVRDRLAVGQEHSS